MNLPKECTYYLGTESITLRLNKHIYFLKQNSTYSCISNIKYETSKSERKAGGRRAQHKVKLEEVCKSHEEMRTEVQLRQKIKAQPDPPPVDNVLQTRRTKQIMRLPTDQFSLLLLFDWDSKYTAESSNSTNSFFERINKINKPLDRLNKKKTTIS